MTLRRINLWWLAWLGVLMSARGTEIATTNPPPSYTLTRCLQRALDYNADIAVARKRIEETTGAVVEARAGFLPSLTSSAGYQKLATDYATLGGTADRRNDLWNVSVRLTQNLYAGGGNAGRMGIAHLNRSTRLLDYEAIMDRVMMETRIAFFDILQNQAQETVHQEAVSFLESELASQNSRLELGSGDRFQVLRAEVSLALECTALVEARTKLSTARVRLGELLAVPATGTNSAPFTVAGELTCTPQLFNLGTCMARALELRPELRGLANDVAVQRKQLVVDRSAMRPRVDLFAGYDVVSEPDRSASHDYYHGALGGAAVTWPWFDGFATRGRMQATRARLEEAQLAQSAAGESVKAEVLRAFQDLAQAEQGVTAQRRNVTLAGESLQLARTNVGLGSATQLELLQSRLDLTRAQTAELSARFDYNAALARLQRAVSSGFPILTELKQ